MRRSVVDECCGRGVYHKDSHDGTWLRPERQHNQLLPIEVKALNAQSGIGQDPRKRMHDVQYITCK